MSCREGQATLCSSPSGSCPELLGFEAIRGYFLNSWPGGRIPAPSPGGTGRTRRSPRARKRLGMFAWLSRTGGWMESSTSAFLSLCFTNSEPSRPDFGVSVEAAEHKRLYPTGGAPRMSPKEKQIIQENKRNPAVVSRGPYLSATSKSTRSVYGFGKGRSS